VFVQDITKNDKTERFVDDEQNEGVLIHAKTTVPAETFSRETMCKPNAPSHCLVGIPCPDDLPFSDALHTKNVFHNEKGGELYFSFRQWTLHNWYLTGTFLFHQCILCKKNFVIVG
jgi:hypothetical protein